MNFIRRLRIPRKPVVRHTRYFDDILTTTIIPDYSRETVDIWVPTRTTHKLKPVNLYTLANNIASFTEYYPAKTIRFNFENPLRHHGFKREWAANGLLLRESFGANSVYIVTDHIDFLDVPPFSGVTLRVNTVSDIEKLDLERIRKYTGSIEYIISGEAYDEVKRQDLHL